MSEESFDFAIAGGSALAASLALCLAHTHGAKVCFIGRMPAPLQIARDIAISMGPYSRPETLALLANGAGELRALLSGAELERRKVVFAALSETGRAAAGHVRHMLAAFDVVTASLPDDGYYGGFAAEGIWALRPRAFFKRMPARLAHAGVTVFPNVKDLQAGHDIVRFAAGNAFFSARRLVVTDADFAKSLGVLPDGIATGWRTALLSEPVPALAGSLIVDIESGGHVAGNGDGRIEALAPFEKAADANAWLGVFLPRGTATQIVARKRLAVLLSRDGAPLIAPIPRKAAVLAIGFGASGAYFAPALACYLTNSTDHKERTWFGARDLDNDRAGVAEIGLVGGGTA